MGKSNATLSFYCLRYANLAFFKKIWRIDFFPSSCSHFFEKKYQQKQQFLVFFHEYRTTGSSTYTPPQGYNYGAPPQRSDYTGQYAAPSQTYPSKMKFIKY